MSDTTGFPDEALGQEAPSHAKHRKEGVAVDGDLDLSEFGENPDTELAG